jgi:glutathione S-transferase
MKLYMTEGSGNAFKVRILLSVLDVPYEKVLVDFANKEHKKEPFLKLNPRGQVPVLEVEGRALWDSTSNLVYIARKYGGERWLPTDPLGMAEVMQWLAFAQNEVHYGLQWARAVKRGIRSGNYEEYFGYGLQALQLLEGHLGNNDWLACGRPTIADVAGYPYVASAPEGGFNLGDYPAVTAWLRRCESIPGWLKRGG